MTNPFEDENGVYHVLVDDEGSIRCGRASSTFRPARQSSWNRVAARNAWISSTKTGPTCAPRA